MLNRQSVPIYARLVAAFVFAYGTALIVGSLARELQQDAHRHHRIVLLLATLPVLIGISYAYLGTLLFRLKYNAWLTAVVLSAATTLLNIFNALRPRAEDLLAHNSISWLRIGLSLGVLAMLLVSRAAFRVRSDMVGFRQAIRLSLVVLAVAFLYGVIGFSVLDDRDFHQEISIFTAIHQTIDQFGLTTAAVVAYTARARVFVDSLSVISTGAVAYVLLAFFQPLRMRLSGQNKQREQAEQLLWDQPSDLDDYFKLWPHDKHYFFDTTGRAGLAYHVARGVALVVADPFGDRKCYGALLESFGELCFLNDWQQAFIHVSDTHRKLYESAGFRLQKLGEEAVLDIEAFQAIRTDKYFRQIRNRFTKLGYSVELVKPPHSAALLQRLRAISDEWLERPGRAERGLMMGYFDDEYLQAGPIAVVRDEVRQIQGFINIVPTYEPHTANYDLLRCSDAAPGNCNDFLLLGLVDALHEQGVKTLNLGLCPLAGLDEKEEEAGLLDTALRLVYANGDRFYSFSGLYRFKAKYKPEWNDRYVAYRGGIPGFTRAITVLTRAMRVK